jgi:hypothetical protein
MQAAKCIKEACCAAQEESAAKTILQEKEERMPRDQGTSANAAAAAKLQREGEVPTWPMFAAPEPAAAAESAWPSIEPMEMHEPQRATSECSTFACSSCALLHTIKRFYLTDSKKACL